MKEDVLKLFVRLINISPRSTLMNVTFDELSTLFDTDPVAAEAKVKEIMEEYISTLTPERQQRAHAFNWRIQQELRNFKDPTARMNRMVEMFWIGVKEFQQTLQNPEEVLNQQGEPSVVKFPKK
jgi:hypothetical protein